MAKKRESGERSSKLKGGVKSDNKHRRADAGGEVEDCSPKLNSAPRHDRSYKRSERGEGSEERASKGSKNKRSDAKELRSTPKYEYILVDARGEERQLILEGRIADRINCLALLCARNSSVENYKQLLYFAKDQRNDIIYLVLKNLRDLLKEKKVEDLYIKSKILKSYEMALKNQYIKDKIVDIVGVLVRTVVYEEEFIMILIERLMENGTTLRLVEKEIRSVFLRHCQLIIEGIEDFYYKNDNFRVQHSLLKFLGTIDFVESAAAFNFYDQALTTLDPEYPKEHRELLIDLIINGLSKSVYEGCAIERIDVIRTYVSSPKTVVSSLRLLQKIKDSYTEAFALKAAKSNVLRNTAYEAPFLNLVFENGSADLLIKLVNTCFYHSTAYVIAILIIAGERLEDRSVLYSPVILARHYHPAVRSLALKLLKEEKITPYDPFDPVVLQGMTEIF